MSLLTYSVSQTQQKFPASCSHAQQDAKMKPSFVFFIHYYIKFVFLLLKMMLKRGSKDVPQHL